MAGYPSFRYHHTDGKFIVTSQEHEDEKCPEEEGWRDTPYSEEEIEELLGSDDEDDDDTDPGVDGSVVDATPRKKAKKRRRR